MRRNPTIARAVGVGVAATGIAARLARRGHLGPAGIVMGAAAAAGWGAFGPRSPIFGPVAWRGDPARPQVALTFDDGPSESTGPILDALAAAGARATFFVLARHVRRHPDLVARMLAEGHQVANHGADHGILMFRGARHVVAQLRECEAAVTAAAGPGAMSRWFRAPHGFRGPFTALGARQAGYRMAGWTAGVFDSAEPGVDVITARSNAALSPGVVLLLHDADGWCDGRPRPQTAEAVPAVCAYATDQGWQMVTMDELFGEPV